jgi:tetratricopeptide (TPR) repeat protein
MRFRDAVVAPRVTAEGEYVFSVTQDGEPPRLLNVTGVIGGGHMIGGGTQGFVTGAADGTVRFLPFDYSAASDEWFCNTGGRSNRGWRPITPNLALADCGDWPPSRVLGSIERFPNCQQCHGSQITVAFDSTAHRYVTRMTALAVNCESCHGPGRRHIETMREGASESTDVGMRALTTLDTDDALEVCFQCHALKHELVAGYVPGMPFRTNYSLGLPAFGDAPLFADGRTRTFAYQEGHLASACYRQGSMTCTDCHDPHAQTYRNHTGRKLIDPFDDGQCVSCHPSKGGAESQRHTRHGPNSPGSRCVSCHMPYLQQPSVGSEIRYARSDHTIPVPRPSFDERLGVQSACALCHAGRPPETLQAQVREWYGDPPPHPPEVRGLLASLPLRDPAGAAALVLGPPGDHEMARFAGLAHFFIRYLEPDMPALPPTVAERLERVSESLDDDVAALALASLHFARGHDPVERERLDRRLRALGPREVAVRRRWVGVLVRRAAAYRAQGDPARAARTLGKALEVAPDDPRTHRELGGALSDAGRYDSALVHLRRSLTLDPAQPLALVSVAFVRIQLGDLAGGLSTYRDAALLNPHEPLVPLSWGNALLRARQFDDAARVFDQAVQIEPGLARAHFGLGAAYAQLGRQEEAIEALRRGLELNPADEGAQALLRQLGG